MHPRRSRRRRFCGREISGRGPNATRDRVSRLVGVGLATGGVGLAILYQCPTGSACYSDALYYTGWALAGPGLVPLAVGALLVYVTTGAGNGRRAAVSPRRTIANWGLSAMPVPGGGFVGASFVF